MLALEVWGNHGRKASLNNKKRHRKAIAKAKAKAKAPLG